MRWIADSSSLAAAIARMRSVRSIGIDTEADSLHSYFDKVCLIQVTADGEDFVIDPLAKLDLAPFGEVLNDPSITKVLHGADYDVRILNRDFRFTIRSLEDTMICAQLLGYEAIGLASLLKRHFELDVDKTHQKADWSMRPLPKALLDYATLDTRHLVELSAKLRVELEALGRWEWALEEFGRLQDIRYEETERDPEAWRVKGAKVLDRRGLAALQRLWLWRDSLARQLDRPAFRIVNNETLVDIAARMPSRREEVDAIRGTRSPHVQRAMGIILGLLDQVRDLPEADLPERSAPARWVRDRDLDRRVDRLCKIRDSVAAELRIQAGTLAPRHVLTAIATMRPESVHDLRHITAMREWQRVVIGERLVAAARG